MDEPAGYGRQGLVAGDMAASQLTLEWRELTGAAPGTCRMTDCGPQRRGCLVVWLSEGLMPWFQANVHCGLTGLLGIAGVPET